MPEFNLINTAIFIALLVGIVLTTVALLTLCERKVAAWVQDRVGPNRVGPFGILQPFVDGGKFFLKEDVIPRHVDKVFFLLAPVAAFTFAMLGIAVVPVGGTTPPPTAMISVKSPQDNTNNTPVSYYEIAQNEYANSYSFAIAPGLDIGMLYTFAIGSLAVYGVIFAGWSSDNKYSLLGALRSSAQIISYEIPLGMSIVGLILVSGSLNLETVIDKQVGGSWNIWFQPLAFLLFFVSAAAECSRLPFDLPESEQELVGGYHTEYSSLKLGMLLLAEYAHLITTCFMLSILFFGGWDMPGITAYHDSELYGPTLAALLKLAVLVTKCLLFIAFFMLIRWTIPRFRFDQLMSLAWKILIPLAILNLLAVMIMKQFDLPYWSMSIASFVLFVSAGAVGLMLKSNVSPRRKVRKLPAGLPAGVTYAPQA